MVGAGVSRRQTRRFNEQQQEDAEIQQSAYEPGLSDAQPAPPPPAPAGGPDDTIDQLQKLGQLRDQGVLTEAEFEAQKAKVLAG
jgi:hypothetical protein